MSRLLCRRRFTFGDRDRLPLSTNSAWRMGVPGRPTRTLAPLLIPPVVLSVGYGHPADVTRRSCRAPQTATPHRSSLPGVASSAAYDRRPLGWDSLGWSSTHDAPRPAASALARRLGGVSDRRVGRRERCRGLRDRDGRASLGTDRPRQEAGPSPPDRQAGLGRVFVRGHPSRERVCSGRIVRAALVPARGPLHPREEGFEGRVQDPQPAV